MFDYFVFIFDFAEVGLIFESVMWLIEMSRFHVGGKVVDKVDLLRKKSLGWRFDVWPFCVLYALWLTTIVPSIDIVDSAIVFGALVALHILVWLFTVWSVDFKCFVHYTKVCVYVFV